MNPKRVFSAFLLSPFVPVCYFLSLQFSFDHSALMRFFDELIGNTLLFVPIGFIAEIIFGIPLLLLLRSFYLTKLGWFLMAGFFISIVIFAFFGWPRYDLKWGLYACVMPVELSTGVFWLIIRPDRKKYYQERPILERAQSNSDS